MDVIRVIVKRENNLLVAECYEYDIGAQAYNLEDLYITFNLCYRLESEECSKRGLSLFYIEKSPISKKPFIYSKIKTYVIEKDPYHTKIEYYV